MDIFDKKPGLFEKTASNIWTDAYLQHQMLREHLNPANDGASRSKESIDKTVDFILSLTNPGSKLLDLGCGPGLYTSVFKDKGYIVTGIDFNKVSIEYASEKRSDIEYITGDYIEEYPEGKFDVVIMIYCDMGTHSDRDRDKLLTNIYSSLNKNGILIFDVFTESLQNDKQEGNNWEYAPEGGFWSEKKYLLLSQTFHYPEAKAFAYQYNLLTGDGNKHFIVWDRYYSEKEIRNVLGNVGFGNVSIHHSLLAGNTFTSNSEMFIVAKKE